MASSVAQRFWFVADGAEAGPDSTPFADSSARGYGANYAGAIPGEVRLLGNHVVHPAVTCRTVGSESQREPIRALVLERTPVLGHGRSAVPSFGRNSATSPQENRLSATRSASRLAHPNVGQMTRERIRRTAPITMFSIASSESRPAATVSRSPRRRSTTPRTRKTIRRTDRVAASGPAMAGDGRPNTRANRPTFEAHFRFGVSARLTHSSRIARFAGQHRAPGRFASVGPGTSLSAD